MAEFKNLLQNWRLYQKAQFDKRVNGANMYRCELSNSSDRSIIDGYLSYVNTQPTYMTVTAAACGVHQKIFLSDLLGFQTEGLSMVLNMRGEFTYTLQFPNQRVHAAAFEKMQIFARDEVNVSTPPSSDEMSE